ncbi:hypothetical protein INR49_018332, partial [Caranx melampygus]
MKIAGLCWLSVVLTFVLSAGDTVTAVDQNWLTSIVEGLKNQYKISDMYSLAASIQGGTSGNLQEIFRDNPSDIVQQNLTNAGIYLGQRLAIATVKKPAHAEYRLLNNLQLVSNTSDLLVIYCYASSCPTTCANRKNPYNILKLIQTVINSGQWSDRAFVFEKIFRPQNSDGVNQKLLTTALQNLGAVIGSQNIFRCYKPQRII